MSTATFKQFRRSELAHAVIGTSGPMNLIACGITYHGDTGTANPRAKKCRTCAAIVRRAPARALPKSDHGGCE